MKIHLLLCVFALCQLTALPLRAEEPGSTAEQAARSFMHHRVLFLEHPSREAVISWTTADELFDAHIVYWDTEARGGDLTRYAHQATQVHSHPYTIAKDDIKNRIPKNIGHSVLLTGLTPATTYYLTVVSGKYQSQEFHFITAPDDDRDIQLLFGGDSRRGPKWPAVHEDRRKVNHLLADLFEKHPDIVALAHGGDYCAKAEWTFMTDWLSDHELTTTKDGRLLPILPARGNHDRAVNFDEMFYWPERNPGFYYATELSQNAVLLTLNTEISHGGDQRDWLEANLKKYREGDRPWILAQYHVPVYGSVKDFEQGASQRQNWVPLFEKYQLDLACESDHHSLKRTVPLFENALNLEKGIVYIGDGGLGVPPRDPDPTRWYLKAPGMTSNGHHVHLLTFSKEKITGQAIGLEEKILDEFVVTPR